MTTPQCRHSQQFIEDAWRSAKQYFIHHYGSSYYDLADDFASYVALKLAQGNRPFRFREMAWVFLHYNSMRRGIVHFADIHADYEPDATVVDERANFAFDELLTSKERNDLIRDLDRRILKPNADKQLYFINEVRPAVGDNYVRNFTKKRSPGYRRHGGGWPLGVRKDPSGKADRASKNKSLLAELTELCERVGKG